LQFYDVQPPEQVIIDVSGPGAIPPATYDTDFNISGMSHQLPPPPSNFTVVLRLDDLAEELQHATATFRPYQGSWTTPLPTDFGSSDVDTDEASDREASVEASIDTTQDLRPDRPVVVYFASQDVHRGVRILDVVPSLSALSKNEICKIAIEDGRQASRTVDGKNIDDNADLFGISAEVRNGVRMSFLYFASDHISLGVYRSEIRCEPAEPDDVDEIDLTSASEPFLLRVEVHVH
jgi:hypothetical protein